VGELLTLGLGEGPDLVDERLYFSRRRCTPEDSSR
jgi:hypothetical protein